MSNSVPPVLPLFLTLEEARASRALDGETQCVAIAQPVAEFTVKCASPERIAALEALLRRWVDEAEPWWIYHGHGVTGKWTGCERCGVAADDGQSMKHDPGCIVGDTLEMLKTLEATNAEVE